MLDGYNANIVDLVPCLVEETSKEMYDTTVDLATPEVLKNAKDYVFKRGCATLLLIGADCGCPDATKHGNGNQQLSQVGR